MPAIIEAPWGWVNDFYGRYLVVASTAHSLRYERLLKTQAITSLF
ncbi:hypothetical protein [Siphonobacter curvatus]|nr:hypothetical protein [Siphonobacter curvatus]